MIYYERNSTLGSLPIRMCPLPVVTVVDEIVFDRVISPNALEIWIAIMLTGKRVIAHNVAAMKITDNFTNYLRVARLDSDMGFGRAMCRKPKLDFIIDPTRSPSFFFRSTLISSSAGTVQ